MGNYLGMTKIDRPCFKELFTFSLFCGLDFISFHAEQFEEMISNFFHLFGFIRHSQEWDEPVFGICVLSRYIDK